MWKKRRRAPRKIRGSDGSGWKSVLQRAVSLIYKDVMSGFGSGRSGLMLCI